LTSCAVAGATNAALAANAIVTNAVRSMVAPSRGWTQRNTTPAVGTHRSQPAIE
jgi:hypothetical protein